MRGEVLAGCPLPRRVYYPSYPVSYGPSYTAAVSYQPVQVAAVAELVTPSVTTVTQFVPVQVAAFSAGFAPAAVVASPGVAAAGAAVAAQQPAVAPAAAQPTNADLLKAIVGINDSLKNTDGRLQRLEAKVFGEPEVIAPPEPKARPAESLPPAADPKLDPKAGRSALQLRGIQVVTARCAGCHDATTAARKGDGFQLTAENYPHQPARRQGGEGGAESQGRRDAARPPPDRRGEGRRRGLLREEYHRRCLMLYEMLHGDAFEVVGVLALALFVVTCVLVGLFGG
jgi:hypothetical protein